MAAKEEGAFLRWTAWPKAMIGAIAKRACSVFGECWKTRCSTFEGAQKTSNCERGEDSFQQ